ncbi:hypothetical protein WG66_008308 [Moniliophthora roreri]|nr:hypothetical protein WG66_008308 [Moniliophthora roreri]
MTWILLSHRQFSDFFFNPLILTTSTNQLVEDLNGNSYKIARSKMIETTTKGGRGEMDFPELEVLPADAGVGVEDKPVFVRRGEVVLVSVLRRAGVVSSEPIVTGGRRGDEVVSPGLVVTGGGRLGVSVIVPGPLPPPPPPKPMTQHFVSLQHVVPLGQQSPDAHWMYSCGQQPTSPELVQAHFSPGGQQPVVH